MGTKLVFVLKEVAKQEHIREGSTLSGSNTFALQNKYGSRFEKPVAYFITDERAYEELVKKLRADDDYIECEGVISN